MYAVDRSLTCCQPAPLSDAEWRARTERLAAARAAAEARMPKACRNCGADDMVETFDPSHCTYACEACGDVGEYRL